MWSRKELKARGKLAFRANYWRSVFVALLVVFVLGSGIAAGRAGVGSGLHHSHDDADGPEQQTQEVDALEDLLSLLPGDVRDDVQGDVIDQLPPELLGQLPAVRPADAPQISGIVIGAVIGALVIAALIFAVIDALLLNPLEVGCRRFFLVNARGAATLSEVVFGYEHSYWNMVKTILLRDIFLFLWSLLLVIPGIVKGYSYRLVPYILADDPTVSSRDAIAISRDMMRGQKWRTFVLDLSFIGWDILSVLTLGLVGVFFASPYQCATDAELYRAIRDGYAQESYANPV